jgi:hypothetical protein
MLFVLKLRDTRSRVRGGLPSTQAVYEERSLEGIPVTSHLHSRLLHRTTPAKKGRISGNLVVWPPKYTQRKGLLESADAGSQAFCRTAFSLAWPCMDRAGQAA